MPLTKNQEKIVRDGFHACKDFADACARMRAMGFPDEAMEERCRAAELTYGAAVKITDEYRTVTMGEKDAPK